MKIKIKGIFHERCEDAPFVGALICANDCKFNCNNCINESLKKEEGYYIDDYKIIDEILSDPFNEGVILAGLEWTLQPQEMIKLIELSIQHGLEVILYTGMDKDSLFKNFPELLNYNIYIKYGRYIEELKIDNNIQYGIKLASINQGIIKILKQPIDNF